MDLGFFGVTLQPNGIKQLLKFVGGQQAQLHMGQKKNTAKYVVYASSLADMVQCCVLAFNGAVYMGLDQLILLTC